MISSSVVNVSHCAGMNVAETLREGAYRPWRMGSNRNTKIDLDPLVSDFAFKMMDSALKMMDSAVTIDDFGASRW